MKELKILSHEELVKLAPEEQQKALLDSHNVFDALAKELSEDEKAIEEDNVIKMLDEYDQFLKEQSYELPEEVKFDGTVYNRATVNKIIVDFLESIEVEWQGALLIYEAIKRMKNDPSTINYPTFDNITRLLGGLKFKGFYQTRDILIVNELFSPAYAGYARDRMYLGYLSMCHNSVIPTAMKATDEYVQEDSHPVE